MSTAESPSDSRVSFLKELADRAGEQTGAWGIPRLLATLNMGQMLHDARRRVHDSHCAQMKQLGIEVDPELADDMISVRGDTTNHIHVAMPQKSFAAKCAPYILGPLVGACGIIAWQWYASRPVPVEHSDTDWRLGIEVQKQP